MIRSFNLEPVFELVPRPKSRQLRGYRHSWLPMTSIKEVKRPKCEERNDPLVKENIRSDWPSVMEEMPWLGLSRLLLELTVTDHGSSGINSEVYGNILPES